MQQQHEKESQDSKKETPPEYLCAITHLIMGDPVSDEDGNTYERDAIERHFRTKHTSPITNLPIGTKLTPNRPLKGLIEKFLSDNPEKNADAYNNLVEDLIKLFEKKDVEAVLKYILKDTTLSKVPHLEQDEVNKILSEIQKYEELEDVHSLFLETFGTKSKGFLLSEKNGHTQFWHAANKVSATILKNMLILLGDSAKDLLMLRQNEGIPSPLLFILIRGDLELIKMAFDKIGDELKTELTKFAYIYEHRMSFYEAIYCNPIHEHILAEINTRFPNLIYQLTKLSIFQKYKNIETYNFYKPLPIVSPIPPNNRISSPMTPSTSPYLDLRQATVATTTQVANPSIALIATPIQRNTTIPSTQTVLFQRLMQSNSAQNSQLANNRSSSYSQIQNSMLNSTGPNSRNQTSLTTVASSPLSTYTMEEISRMMTPYQPVLQRNSGTPLMTNQFPGTQSVQTTQATVVVPPASQAFTVPQNNQYYNPQHFQRANSTLPSQQTSNQAQRNSGQQPPTQAPQANRVTNPNLQFINSAPRPENQSRRRPRDNDHQDNSRHTKSHKRS